MIQKHLVDNHISYDEHGWYSTHDSVYYTNSELDKFDLP